MSERKVSIKYTGKLVGLILLSVMIGRIGTAYLVGESPNLSMFFTFVGTAVVSYLLAFFLFSPKFKDIPLKNFVAGVLPVAVLFIFAIGGILHQTTKLI
ncbi:hypothetical protein M662_02405 [Bacillus sp. SB49]|uniref:hypothetical protein n=1 Tax=Bacillaceae TaxID=186817 RepID=UPI0002A4EE83|nr:MULTISPECIES: hypothetical protein [Bacillaceae]ELK45398.1 hypothetical protein D479_15092 [Halobacillus sp. BAB-2008]QHT45409.1 hypothetical protein M662_02405 [Bacillus sp. SB49]